MPSSTWGVGAQLAGADPAVRRLWLRGHDLVKVRAPSVERVALLVEPSVAHVGGGDVAFGVTEHTGDAVLWNAEPRHRRRGGAPQIVQAPSGDFRLLHERGLQFA